MKSVFSDAVRIIESVYYWLMRILLRNYIFNAIIQQYYTCTNVIIDILYWKTDRIVRYVSSVSVMVRYKKHPSNTHPPVCSSFSSDKRDRFIPLLGDRNTGGEVMREIYYDWKFIRQFFLLLSAKVQPGNTQIFVNCKWKNPSICRQALIANRELIQNIQKLWFFFHISMPPFPAKFYWR